MPGNPPSPSTTTNVTADTADGGSRVSNPFPKWRLSRYDREWKKDEVTTQAASSAEPGTTNRPSIVIRGFDRPSTDQGASGKSSVASIAVGPPIDGTQTTNMFVKPGSRQVEDRRVLPTRSSVNGFFEGNGVVQWKT
jgi:hypothetical protein